MEVKRSQKPMMLRIGPFGGIDLSSSPAEIDQKRSPDMVNFSIDERGSLNKRTGYERIYLESLGNGAIHGMHEYRKKDGTVRFLLAHGNNLYTQSGDQQPVLISSILSDQQISFFDLNDKCYIMDGASLLVYDGVNVTQPTPYIPTLTVSNEPLGGGTPYEDFNLIGKGFKESFSGDGTATVYQLSLKGLDGDLVKVSIDAVSEKVEGEADAGFTVDRAAGKITFTTAPPTGTNNVIITAFKTISGLSERVLKCRFHTMYGGSNDTRVFISGNPDYPNHIWRSGLYDPSYWPENGFYKIGADNDSVKGFCKQYDTLVIIKERSLWNMSYELNNGVPSFPIKPINDQIGASSHNGIQLIENSPVFLSKKGVYLLNSSNVRDERNVTHISERVDSRLLKEPGLHLVKTVDFDKKYWVAVNFNVYIYDYILGEWYIYDNIPASCFLERDGVLYFGDSTKGVVYRFVNKNAASPYHDDAVPVKAYWYSKLLDFDLPEFQKIIQKLFIDMKPDKHTSVNVYTRSDRKHEQFLVNNRMDQFNFMFMDFSKFSFVTSDIPQEKGKKLKMKKITHFQFKLENTSGEESLGVIGISIKYGIQNEVK